MKVHAASTAGRRASGVLTVAVMVAAWCAPGIVHAQSVVATSAQGASPSPPPTVDAAESASPRLQHFVLADYPAEARAAGLDGSVVLRLTIDASGNVSDAEVVQSAGHGFDVAALAAARQFQFTPARQNGLPVAARIRYRYRFTLGATTAPSTPRGPIAVLRGVVRDASNHALAGATVTVQLGQDTPRTATTDGIGGFRFDVDRAGDASVRVHAPGFAPFHADESLHAQDDLQVTYRLARDHATSSAPPTHARASSPAPHRRDASRDDTLVVRGARPPREVTRTSLDRDEITRVPGAGGDALRSIQNLPSVARPPLMSGDLVIRGSGPGDTAVFVDGTDLPLLYHFSALTSTIPTEFLDHIDFYPGNFSARYGRAMGGIVDVGLRSPRERGARGVINLSVIDASLFAEGRVAPNFSIALGLRKSWVDQILGVILRDIAGVATTAAPSYWDYQLVAEWRPTSRMRLRLSFLGDDDSVVLLLQNPMDSLPFFSGQFALATRYHFGQLLWTHDLAPGVRQRAMVSVGWSGTRFGGSDQFSYTEDHYPVNFRYELSATLSPLLRFHTGLDAQVSPDSEQFVIPSLDAADTATAPRIASTIHALSFNPSWYAEAEITPGHGLRLVPGLRFDYFHVVRSATLSPRFAARWEFVHGWTLKGGVGLFTQSPSFDTASPAANTLIPGQTIGNPNLLPQRAMHYALGLEHVFQPMAGASWLGNVTLAFEGFYKTLDDLVVSTPTFDLFNRPPPPPYTSTGIGRVYGVDLLLRHRPSSHFFGWIAYTLMRSERRDGPGQDWHAYDYDQTHILTVVGSYTIGWGWSAGLRFRFVTGSPTTPITGTIYNADTMQYFPIQGALDSQRAADFHQLDLRIDKTFQFSWGRIGAYLEVLNVYNHLNQEGVTYNFNYTRSTPFTGLPIIPNLGLRGEF